MELQRVEKQLSTYARNEKIATFKRDLMSDRQMEKEYMGKYLTTYQSEKAEEKTIKGCI